MLPSKMPKCLEESWKEYKDMVASLSPKFIKKIINYEYFDKMFFFSFIIAMIYIILAIYFSRFAQIWK
jgi:uncharacterized membrane protein YagU involved in acid resistance